jgi:hypothetical protein
MSLRGAEPLEDAPLEDIRCKHFGERSCAAVFNFFEPQNEVISSISVVDEVIDIFKVVGGHFIPS